ncbi:MAG: PilZ domain-containing protein [Nitrospiraceae bacterium]|nr:PilZ domain-containing protein [Nitrospiraceae bacterium]
MPFTRRPSRRCPGQCSVTYHVGPFQGQGTVWNLSLNGWKLSGDVPLRVGETCSLTVNLPNQESLYVAAAIVRWVRGQEYGLETLMVEKQTQSQLAHIINRLVTESGESTP